MRSVVLIVLVAALLGLASAQFDDCGLTPANLTNYTARCNRSIDCQVCERNDYSFDWLCCEDYGGRPAAYFVTGALIQVYFKNPYFTAFSFVFYEVLEKIYLQRYANSYLDYESVMGSFVGDFFQGLAGMQFAASLVYAFGLPSLIPSYKRAFRKNMLGDRMILIAAAVGHILSVFLLLIIGVTYNWGLIAHACVQVAFLWLANPFWLWSGRPEVVELVWTDRDGTLMIGSQRRQIFFFVLGAALVATEFMNFGWEFMANDWFQSWVIIGPLVIGTAIIALGIAIREHLYEDAVQQAGYLLLSLAVAFYYVGGGMNQVSYHWAALFLLIGGVLVVFGSLQMAAEHDAKRKGDIQTDVNDRFL